MTKVLHVVTNVDHFEGSEEPTGLWLSELVHTYDQLEEAGVEQVIASPAGGKSPLEPKSLLPVIEDKASKARHEDPEFMALLENTVALDDVDWHDFDAIYLTGGHGVMYDFPGSAALQKIIAEMDADGRIISSVCHGYAGFLEAKRADGMPFVQGKKVTGFSWAEEIAAGVAKKVPYNVEEKTKDLGADYEKGLIPMTKHVVVDGNLITGQNPMSAKGVGEELVKALQAK